MKQLTITTKIHPNSLGLKQLKNTSKNDIIDLSMCKFVCSDALEIVKEKIHPSTRTRIILSNEIKELIDQSNK